PAWDFSASDHQVAHPGEDLRAIEQNWRWRLSAIPIDLAVGKESRCFYQTQSESHIWREHQIIAPQVICGPYRPLASETTLWDVATMQYDPLAKSLSITGQGAFSPGKPLPDSRGARPDGKVPQFDIDIAEPDSPMADVGDVVTVAEGTLHEQTALSNVIRIPGWEFAFTAGRHERFGTIANRRTAPNNSTFLTLQTFPTAIGDAPVKPVVLSVLADGKQFPIENATTPQEVGVALPATAKKVQIAVTFDGLTQTLDVADGTRNPGGAALLYENQRTAVVAGPTPFSSGSPSAVGPYVNGSLNPMRTSLSAWDSVLGWAPDGSMWITIDSAVAVTQFQYTGVQSDDYYRVQSVAPALSAAASVAARSHDVQLTNSGIVMRTTVQVPLTPGTVPLTLALKATGPKSVPSTTPHPEQLTAELSFGTTITVT
ncbi:MAG: hypothetical protein ACRCWS_07845, partial [Propionibacteriaceae bacterium]